MNRHSGTLVVNDGKREKKIFFAEGEICLLSSGRRMRLGDLLVAAGKITGEDLDLALKLQKQSRKRLGEILVEEGFCEDEDVTSIVRMQVEEELYDLFLWRKAEFEFLADTMPDSMAAESPNLTRLHINTNSLIMEALRRLDEWTLIQDAVPSTKEVFVLADGSLFAEAEVPEAVKASPSETIDGKTTVMGLAERWFISEFECCQHLANLVKLGAVRALRQDELADQAEAAYALNDFNAAAALYGRLAEYHPDQPKISIPLADSLRRTGGEKQALSIYEDLAKRLEEGGEDPDRLRQCYEAILQLDPSRRDLANRIEDLDLSLASSGSGRRAIPLVIGGLLVLLAAVGIFASGILKTDPSKGNRDEDVLALINAMTASEKDADALLREGKLEEASEKLADWHKKARQIWTDYADTKDFDKVTLPALVSTSPPGFAIYLRYGDNEYYQGNTSLTQPHVICKYGPVVSSDPDEEATVSVRIYTTRDAKKAGESPRHEVDIPAATYTKPLQVAIYEKPRSQIIVDGRIDVGGVFAPEINSIVFASRDGKLRVMELAESGLTQKAGWDDKLRVGRTGDTLSSPVHHAGSLLVGVVEYEGKPGVAHLTLKAGEEPTPPSLRYPTESPVLAAPVVLTEGDPLVLAGTLGGALHAFSLAGQERWVRQLDGALRFDLVVVPGEPQRVLVLSDDGAARAYDAQGKVAWQWRAPAPFYAAPLLTDAGVLLTLTSGRVVLLDKRNGSLLRDVVSEASKVPPAIAVNEDGLLIVAESQGRVRALRGTKTRWDVTLRRGVGGQRPWLLPHKDRIYLSLGGPEFLALESEKGRIVWLGTFPQQGRVNSPIRLVPGGVAVTTNKNLIYLFDRPKDKE